MSLFRKSGYMLGAQAVALMTGFVSSIVTARLLGPEGKGVIALSASMSQLAVAILALGTGSGLAFLAGKRRFPVPELLGAAAVLGLAFGGIVGVSLVLAQGLLLSTILRGVTPQELALIALTIPFVFSGSFIGNVLLGEGAVARLAAVQAVAPMSTFVFLTVALVLVGPTASTALAALLIATAANSAFALVLGARKHGLSLRHLSEVTREALSYGVRIVTGSAANTFWLRADVFFLNYLGGPAQVGVYSVSTNLAEKIWLLDESIGAAVFSEVVSRDPEESAALALRTARMVGVLALVGSLLLAVVSAVLIPVLYGPRFAGAIGPLMLLLPGVVAVGIGRPLSAYFSGQLSRPGLTSVAAVLGAIVAAIAYFGLIPKYGAMGAAIGSSLSYSAPLVFYSLLLGRYANSRPRDLIPRAEDAALIVDFLRRAAGKVAVTIRMRRGNGNGAA